MGVSFPLISWGGMMPFLIVTATGLLVLILDPLTAPDRGEGLILLSLGGIAAAAVASPSPVMEIWR